MTIYLSLEQASQLQIGLPVEIIDRQGNAIALGRLSPDKLNDQSYLSSGDRYFYFKSDRTTESRKEFSFS